MQHLPFSQSCENNKGPILGVLQRVFADCETVLEIASGTGQHATWFASRLPHLTWQPTEMPANMALLKPRCELYTGCNLLRPVPLDVSSRPWRVSSLGNALFTANSLHIMPWESVVDLFAELGERADGDTLLAIYGPFNYGGQYTSPSNARFDQWLAEQSSHSAIRDIEEVSRLGTSAGFRLQEDNEMPANNRLLVFCRDVVSRR